MCKNKTSKQWNKAEEHGLKFHIDYAYETSQPVFRHRADDGSDRLTVGAEFFALSSFT